jgi:Arc/MetJ family transcription regulator
MRAATKANKTFSLDKDILAAVRRTKGAGSESERVNKLLKFALDIERRAALHEEAAAFFAGAPDDRQESRAYEAAAIHSWARD